MRAIYAVLICLLLISAAFAEEAAQPNNNHKSLVTFEYELDLYYLPLDLFMSLTNAPIPDVSMKNEMDIYRDLMFNSYKPRFVVLEASINPMPVLGAYLKKNQPDFYDSAEVGTDLNLIKAITAGMEEPYAISLFFGDVVNFTRPDNAAMTGGNKGYHGYLISYGDHHIKDNTLIDDHWYEVEWKIKGDWVTNKKTLSWSFRVGTKQHDHPEISDEVYVSLRRSRLDTEGAVSSFVSNGAIQYTISFTDDKLNLTQQELFVEKKFPLGIIREKLSGNLALGVIYNTQRKYSGKLKEEGVEEYQFIIRPNVEF